MIITSSRSNLNIKTMQSVDELENRMNTNFEVGFIFRESNDIFCHPLPCEKNVWIAVTPALNDPELEEYLRGFINDCRPYPGRNGLFFNSIKTRELTRVSREIYRYYHRKIIENF